MSKKWLIALASTLLFAPSSWALGLGEIDIKSKLNQPLDAEIEITSATASELQDVQFSIPDTEVFSRYNLDRPQVLNSVRFVIENRGTSKQVIRLASSQVVKDPFLTFLIQADWPQGRMLREYTVLVDPPLFVPSQSVTETQAYVDGARVNTRASSSTQGSIAGRNNSTSSGSASGNQNYSNYSRSELLGDSYRVKRGDTLWEIANSVKPDDSFSVNQTMMAIFRNNPEAFEGNINRLKAGQVLSVPTRNQINTFTLQSANQAVRTQTKDWRDNTGDYKSSTATSNASTSGSTSTVDKGESQESSEGRLELKVPDLSPESELGAIDLKGEGLGGSTAENQQVVNELQAKVEEFERLLSAKDNELASLQQELAKSRGEEVGPSDASESHGLETAEIDPEPVDVSESQETPDVSIESPVTDIETTVEPVETTTPEVVEPAETKIPVVSAPQEDGNILAIILKIAAGLGLALLGLFGFLFIRNRNKGPSHDTLFVDEDLDTAVEDIAERIKSKIGNKYNETAEVEILKNAPPLTDGAEATSTTDESLDFNFETSDTAEVAVITESVESDEALPFDDTTLADVSMGSMEMDSNDPIAETDFHMAYGLYDQAADIMSSAITETDSFEFKEKLLEVFFVSGNKEEFTRYSAEIKDEAQASHPSSWDNIVIMGKQIAPDEAMFSGDVSTAGIDEGLDFSLDETGQVEVDQSLFSDLEAATDVVDESNNAVDLDFSDSIETDLGNAEVADSNPLDASPDVIDLDFSDPLEADLETTDLSDSNNEDANSEGIDLDFSDSLDADLGIGNLSESQTDDASLDLIDLDFSDPIDASADIVDLGFSESLETDTQAIDDDVLDISLDLDLPEAPVDLEGVIENFGSDLDASLNSPIDSDLQANLQNKIDQISDSDEVTKEINVEDFLDLDIGSDTASIQIPDLDLTSADTGIGSDAENTNDESLDFSFDLNSTDGLSSDDFNLDLSDETQNLNEDFLDNFDTESTRTQEMKIDDNFDLLLDGNSATSENEIDLDLETFLSEGLDEEFSDDTKRSMLPDGVTEADSGTMSLSTLNANKEDKNQSGHDFEDVFNVDDTHASTAQITDEELAAMGLSDDGPELMGVTGMSFDDTGSVDEVSTKLDLARAYIEMDDPENAKDILQEVIDEGNAAQQNEAKSLKASLS